MAPRLVFKYFNIEGVAEAIRWALELSGLDWEDKRLATEEFLALKPSLPNGQLPVLEIDDYVLPQTLPILRYVGKLGGLYPAEDLEAAKCDAVTECATDFYVRLRSINTEKDQNRKLEICQDVTANFFPTWLSDVEKQLAATEGVYFEKKMSVADLTIAHKIKFLKDGALDGIPTTIADSYPNLNALYDNVVKQPKIAAYIAKHVK